MTSPQVAKEILEARFNTPYGEREDAECVARVRAIEQSYSSARDQRASARNRG